MLQYSHTSLWFILLFYLIRSTSFASNDFEIYPWLDRIPRVCLFGKPWSSYLDNGISSQRISDWRNAYFVSDAWNVCGDKTCVLNTTNFRFIWFPLTICPEHFRAQCLFLTIWMLAIVSVMIGIFASTFARHEGHILPFIPLIILPSFFLSGLLIDTDKLPGWAEFLGKCLPFRYANNIVQKLIVPDQDLSLIYQDFFTLFMYIVVLLIIASKTLKDLE